MLVTNNWHIFLSNTTRVSHFYCSCDWFKKSDLLHWTLTVSSGPVLHSVPWYQAEDEVKPSIWWFSSSSLVSADTGHITTEGLKTKLRGQRWHYCSQCVQLYCEFEDKPGVSSWKWKKKKERWSQASRKWLFFKKINHSFISIFYYKIFRKYLEW